MTERVCPVCFRIWPPGSLPAQWPVCSDCDGEGIGVDAVPLPAFLEAHPPEELRGWLRAWQKTKGVRGEYKAAKAARIRILIRRRSR